MHLTFLGTGSAMPTGQHYQAGYLLEDDTYRILIDCGAGILQRLAQTDRGYTDLDALVLTHHHLDHVADLLPLLKARRLAEADTLPIYGPPGTTMLLDQLVSVHEYLAGTLSYEVTELTPPDAFILDLSVMIHETGHSMQCFAYRFCHSAGDLVLSGDAPASTSLAEFADGAAVLVHDCSFPDGMNGSNHATPTNLGTALSEFDIGRVILTHRYPSAVAVEQTLCEIVGSYVDGPVDALPDGSTVLIAH